MPDLFLHVRHCKHVDNVYMLDTEHMFDTIHMLDTVHMFDTIHMIDRDCTQDGTDQCAYSGLCFVIGVDGHCDQC